MCTALEHAELIIDAQKKLCVALGLPTADPFRPRRTSNFATGRSLIFITKGRPGLSATHRALDQAVAEAYGVSADLADDDLLGFLLDRNHSLPAPNYRNHEFRCTFGCNQCVVLSSGPGCRRTEPASGFGPAGLAGLVMLGPFLSRMANDLSVGDCRL